MYNLLDVLHQQPHYAIAPLIIAGLIAAASSIISGIVKSKSDKNANQQQIEYNQAAYGQQRADALADWTKQTEYNSPTSQMARLRQAGLNPILAAGNITSQSPVVRSSDYQSYTPKSTSPLQGLGDALSGAGDTLTSYYDTRIKEAQYDNLKTQNTVMLQHSMLEAAQVAATEAMTHKTGADTAMSQFTLQQQQRLADTSAQIQEQNLKKLEADTSFTVHQDKRADTQLDTTVKEAATRITNNKLEAIQKQLTMAKTRQETDNLKKEQDRINALTQSAMYDNAIKSLELKMRENGIEPHDPLWQRSIKRMLDNLLSDGKDPYLK